jgi:hypothetical protein
VFVENTKPKNAAMSRAIKKYLGWEFLERFSNSIARSARVLWQAQGVFVFEIAFLTWGFLRLEKKYRGGFDEANCQLISPEKPLDSGEDASLLILVCTTFAVCIFVSFVVMKIEARKTLFYTYLQIDLVLDIKKKIWKNPTFWIGLILTGVGFYNSYDPNDWFGHNREGLLIFAGILVVLESALEFEESFMPFSKLVESSKMQQRLKEGTRGMAQLMQRCCQSATLACQLLHLRHAAYPLCYRPYCHYQAPVPPLTSPTMSACDSFVFDYCVMCLCLCLCVYIHTMC